MAPSGKDKKKLTDKERRFCEEYVIDWNATRSAIAAGYSKKTAAVIGFENLTKPYIKEYISKIKEDLSKLSGVTALRNILELKKMAYSNIADLKIDWDNLQNWDELTEDQKASISEVITTINVRGKHIDKTVKIKLHDKKSAIEVLNKMLGFNSAEKTDIKETIGLSEETISLMDNLNKKLNGDTKQSE